MIEPLTPQELGDAGEDLFRSLCTNARLIPNRSERDRTGWDFRVEFQMQAAGQPLDQRLPRICQVQVKSTAGESGTRVSASLSAVERLAKDPAPAAIVIFRLRPNGEPLMGYLVHLIDGDLSRILHRLRRAEAMGRHDLHHLSISFDYRKAQRFEPTPEGLYQALSKIVGDDPALYAARKQDQLANLGYPGGGGLEAEVQFWAESKDQLIRILSGLEPLRPLRVQAFDRRFDIRIPYAGSALEGVEEFVIQLPQVGACDIIIRNGPLQPAALFHCEAFASPPIEGGPRLIVKHPALHAMFTEQGLELQTTGVFQDDSRDIEAWILVLRGLTHLASGSGTIELVFGDTRVPPMASTGLHGPHLDDLPAMLAFVEGWRDLVGRAGTRAGAAFTLDELWEADAARIAIDMIANPVPSARLEFDLIGDTGVTEALEALYFNTVAFAGARISFATRVTFERPQAGSIVFRSTGFDLVDIRPGVIDLKAYGSQVAATENISILLDPENLEFVRAAKPAD